ncbi:unnamed protein product [Rotaria sp. Silwood1]|nr:unnamed protein product [Rotaria sp. Silwood1]
MDFAGPICNSKWLILIDAKSKFPIVADTKNDTTAKSLCDALEQVIDWFGPSETLVSDNGPPFNSYEMNQFYEKYDINHITTTPYHPASNGLTERFFRSFKEGMLKEQQMGQTNKLIALRNVLRSYRWTPHTATGSSLANMLLQHQIRTELDIMKPNESITPRQQTRYAVGQLVWTLKHQLNKRPQWQQAIITKNISSMIYKIQLRDGQRYKHHQNQLRPCYSSNTQSSEIGSLPDILLNTKSQSKISEFSHPSSPRLSSSSKSETT